MTNELRLKKMQTFSEDEILEAVMEVKKLLGPEATTPGSHLGHCTLRVLLKELNIQKELGK